MEAKLIDKFVEFKGFPSECFDGVDWAQYEAFEVGYMRALFEFGEFSGLKKEVQKFLTNIPEEENNEYFDVNNRKLEVNDVIDIKQTVNGNNLFRITSLNPLNIVYHESGREYEYDKKELLSPFALNGDVEWEIVSDKVEIWKDIIGYEGLYQISSFGRVKSLGREIISKYGLRRLTKERFLTTSLNNEGWLRVTLFKDNKRKYFVLGRLVAKHFLKDYNSNYTISYKDGDTFNCNVNNLYVTHKLK